MSDTPETDAVVRNAKIADHPPTRLAAILTVKCEKLERERDEARAALREAIQFRDTTMNGYDLDAWIKAAGLKEGAK